MPRSAAVFPAAVQLLLQEQPQHGGETLRPQQLLHGNPVLPARGKLEGVKERANNNTGNASWLGFSDVLVTKEETENKPLGQDRISWLVKWGLDCLIVFVCRVA